MPNTEDELTQAMGDLPACGKDIQTFSGAMERYQLNDPENIYNLDQDPTQKVINKTMMTIMKRLKKKPDLGFLINFLLAGHGMQKNGMQIVLINEFDKTESFYKVW